MGAIARWIPAAGQAALIFILSAQPDLHLAPEPLLDFVLHKLAHLVAYAALAFLVAFALDVPPRTFRAVVAGALLLSVAYAATDEFHQAFVHGRGSSPVDVLIDAVGALAGILAWRYVRRRGVDSRP